MAEAFEAVPRAGFLPPETRHRAAYDGPVPIGHQQTSSQPRTVAAMLRLLDAHRGQRILDVGAGSGWTTALVAHLVGSDGRVLGVELVEELAAWGAANLAAAAYPWASIRPVVPGVLGLPDEAPFDRILVSADAQTFPGALAEQLLDGGRMVLPVHGIMTLAVRDGEDLALTRHGHYRFVPLL